MLGNLIRPDIAEMIRERKFNELREFLLELAVPDLAELLADSSPEDRAVLFRLLPRELAAETFEYLPSRRRRSCSRGSATSRWRASSTTCARRPHGPARGAARARSRSGSSPCCRPQERAVRASLLGYARGDDRPPDDPGLRRGPRRSGPIEQVLDHVRTPRPGQRDAQRHLRRRRPRPADRRHADPRGPARPARPARRATSWTASSSRSTPPTTKETAVERLPQVRPHGAAGGRPAGMLVGIVTIDDVLDVAEEEATEDIQRFGGMEALDEPYVATPLSALVRKRATLAGRALPRRDAHGDGDGLLRGGDRARRWCWRCSCR